MCTPKIYKVAIEEALRFMVDSLHAAGANCTAATQQAELLLQADKYGHPSHGMNRLEMYINDIISGSCQPNNKPVILKESPSTAWIDGKNVLGATVSHIAVDIAITKALNTGVGWVTVKGSNHNGIAGFWAKKAACQGMIGMSLTNTSPLVAPSRSKEAALGTNPLAVVAPGSDCEMFYLDMATSAVALGKIEMQRRKKEPLPPGWAQGADGNETTDAAEAYKTMRLYPLGGLEKTSGHKGYGLGAMVDLLTGITAGSNYGHHIRKWTHAAAGKPANIGHCFAAINPECFAPGFGDRLTEAIRHWRKLSPVDPCVPVLAPGDKEKQAEIAAEKNGTVPYVQSQIDTCAALAKKLKIKPIVTAK